MGQAVNRRLVRRVLVLLLSALVGALLAGRSDAVEYRWQVTTGARDFVTSEPTCEKVARAAGMLNSAREATNIIPSFCSVNPLPLTVGQSFSVNYRVATPASSVTGLQVTLLAVLAEEQGAMPLTAVLETWSYQRVLILCACLLVFVVGFNTTKSL